MNALRIFHRVSRTAIAVSAVALPQFAFAALIGSIVCGEISPPGQFGPFDYRTAPTATKRLVEDYHFSPGVEALTGVGGSGSIGADIDYTLRAFPNNPRALLAMSKWSLKKKAEKPSGARWNTECYFERAIRFTPDDPMPHLLYAHYLKTHNRAQEVPARLAEVERLRGDPSNFDLDYNLGLLYFDVGMHDKAAAAAKRAYDLGAPLPALARKLKSVGKWKE